ncbi:MAG: REP-associated tyrosine transposase [Elusimicrobiota bacterium]
MPRPPRIHYPGAVYHAMARGVDGRDIFVNDEDRHDFMGTLLCLKSQTPFSILAYCLMGNHFHLAIRVEKTSLSDIMHRLLTAYVRRFNARHAREGHLLQARYKSILCLDDAYLLALIRYIHMNPVRAGLVASPGDWPWSSDRQYAGKSANSFADTRIVDEAASACGPDGNNYEQWSTKADADFKPWPTAEAPSQLLRSEAEETTTIDTLASDLFPDDWPELRSGSRRRALTNKKALLAAKAVQGGHAQASIAAWMNCSPQAVHQLLQRNKLI